MPLMFDDRQRGHLKDTLGKDDPRIGKDPDGHLYMPTHEVIDTANALFGYGMWDSEVRDLRLVHEGEQVKQDGKVNLVCIYLAIVRVTVRDEAGATCYHEDSSTGEAYQSNKLPPPHDLAAKAAVSTAMKRALRKFGNQFGSSLYDKEDHGGWGARDLSDHFSSQPAAATPPEAPRQPEPTPPPESRREPEPPRAAAPPTAPAPATAQAPASAAASNLDADQVIAELTRRRNAGQPPPALLTERGWTTPKMIRMLSPEQLAQVKSALAA